MSSSCVTHHVYSAEHITEASVPFWYFVVLFFLMGIATLSRETALSKLLFLPSEKGSFLKGKNLLPKRAGKQESK